MNPNDPAFPVSNNNLPQGISTRAYFVAKAMQGLLACPTPLAADELVKQAVLVADLELAELDK